MRVAVDGRSLGDPHGRGIARYLGCLLEELERLPGDDRFEVVPRRGRALYAAAALAGRPRLDRFAGGCDVAWAPAPAPLAVSAGVPLVLTVHDLSFEHRPADFSAYERLWHRIADPRALARRAARVIAVSEAVRDQLLAEWALPADRVITVRSGPGRPAPAPEGRPPTPEFFLAVGALERRKDPELLVRAHTLARERGLQAGLRFAGDGPLRAAVEAGGADVLGHVSDSELDALYPRALALVLPSREEGFGFTPLEALAHGVPVVAADLPVLAETAGGGALRVPPGDAEALADALLRLEREPELRERLVTEGREAVARLSWERAARETREALVAAAS